ncbi:hypothetical protein [Planctomycetes bacterium Poly30]|uniref:hypothetical protein n=1 Tax=Saltatorellus ferox TaxID=2528018 RepID=UPI0011A99743
MTVATSGAAAFLGLAVNASEGNMSRADRFGTTRAGRSVNKLLAENLWSSYQRNLGGADPSVASLRAYLDAQGFPHSPGPDPARVEVLGRLGLAQDAAGHRVFGNVQIDSVLVHRVDEARATRLIVTTLPRTRRGIERSHADVATQETDVFALEPARWDGLDYTLLANNINCIMCHTHVDDARRIYAGTAMLDAGEFQRARVGSIESFQFREDPDSTIAGTLYLGGPAIDADGRPITDWAHLPLKGAALDGSGRLIEDGYGGLVETDLVPADMASPIPYQNLYVDYLAQASQVDGTLPDRFPPPFRDDGGFDPATGTPTPAGADNRIVDDNEFAGTVASYNGTLSGGAISVIAPGDRITTDAAARALVAGTDTGLGAVTEGNVVLTGTDSRPIRINGDVAIDGDLIISGPIEGTGSLWVRGNIYVRGDLEYADMMSGSDRQFGISPRGVSNALAMTAGGNVVIGDPFRPQWGEGAAVDGTPSGTWNFTLEQTAVFNRREWIKTQPTLPGQLVSVQVGTRDVQRELFQSVPRTEQRPVTERRDTGRTREVPVFANVQIGTREEPVYETVTIPSTRPAPYGTPTYERRQVGTRSVPIMERQQTGTRREAIFEDVVTGYTEVVVTEQVPYSPRRFETTTEPVFEMQRPQHPNPEYRGPNFIPRYYALGEGDPVPVQNVEGYFDPATQLWLTDERVDAWDASKLTIADPNDPADPTLFPAGRPAAVIETLEPTGGWMDSDILRGLITEALEARDPNRPLTVDATIYSSNSVFGLVPNSPSEGTNGAFRVEGSILAADVGLLGPAGTELLYDPRSQSVLDIRDESKMSLTLQGSVPAPRP